MSEGTWCFKNSRDLILQGPAFITTGNSQDSSQVPLCQTSLLWNQEKKDHVHSSRHFESFLVNSQDLFFKTNDFSSSHNRVEQHFRTNTDQPPPLHSYSKRDSGSSPRVSQPAMFLSWKSCSKMPSTNSSLIIYFIKPSSSDGTPNCRW